MVKQINLWGEEQEIKKSVCKSSIKEIFVARNYRESEDKKNHSCKVCEHRLTKRASNTYFKCALNHPHSYEASDIRLKNVCDLFKKIDK
jgi:hypothetical protein